MTRTPGSIAGRKVFWFAFSLFSGMGSLLAYVTLEWLFFMTKPSMFSGVPLIESVSALISSPAPVVVTFFQVQLILSLAAQIVPFRARGVALIPGGIMLGLMLVILADNFTYVMLGGGIVTAGPIMRLVYVVALVGAVFFAGRVLYQWAVRLAVQPAGRRRAVLTAMAIFGVVPLLGLLGRTDLPEVAGVEQSEPAREPVPLQDPGPIAPPLERYPNILILSADGIPAERVSVYGYGRKTTPFLASLREDWLLAENAFANSGRTHGSLNSILTGKLPISTRVIFPPQIFRGVDSEQHLPGLLKLRGYRTAQLGMRHYADAQDAGLIGAFDLANYRWERSGGTRPADIEPSRQRVELVRSEVALFREAMRDRLTSRLLHIFGLRLMVDAHGHVTQQRESAYWNDRRRVKTAVEIIRGLSSPWFLQIHLIDTHCCNRNPRASFFSYFGSKENDARFDAEIRDADNDFEEIVGVLQSRGQLENTIIVVTSDHTPRWTTDGRLPLMIRFPHGEYAGRISENVQLVDIAPTILDYLDLPIPSWMEGRSLISEPLDPSRAIFGTGKMGDQKAGGGELGQLADIGPPRFGVVSATLIVGDQFFEIDLATGELKERRIENHTRPLESSLPQSEARVMLVEKLLEGGFGPPPDPRSQSNESTVVEDDDGARAESTGGQGEGS